MTLFGPASPLHATLEGLFYKYQDIVESMWSNARNDLLNVEDKVSIIDTRLELQSVMAWIEEYLEQYSSPDRLTYYLEEYIERLRSDQQDNLARGYNLYLNTMYSFVISDLEAALNKEEKVHPMRQIVIWQK